jgi:uncharacterized protein (TIGR02246 family)
MKKILSMTLALFCFFAAECRAADDVTLEAQKIAGDFFRIYAKTFDSGDAKALSGLWIPEGEIVNAEGLRIIGREAIEKTFAEFFAKNAGSKITIELISAKSPSEGVVVAEILPKIDPPIDKTIYRIGAIAVLVKDKSGKWLIEGVRERTPVPASYEYLKPLEWMVGDWKANAKNAEGVHFSMHCHWTDNKSFLICMYMFRMQDSIRHGTEVIGWDPKEKKIRSWMFDSTGGFTQGIWQKDGKRWTIDISGVTPDGKTVKNTHFLAEIDADAFSFESKNRTIDGQPATDIPLLQMQRTKSNLPADNAE